MTDSRIAVHTEIRDPGVRPISRIDTLFVRNGFILEPIRLTYIGEEDDPASKNFKSTERLRWYCMTDYGTMTGMMFDIESGSRKETIKVYKTLDRDKKGDHFYNEPLLSNGIQLQDYTKEKDTVINGAKCLLLRNEKVVSSPNNPSGNLRVVRCRIGINPLLSGFAYPFISKNLPEHFGGGAVVYEEVIRQAGYFIRRYDYSSPSKAEVKLFDQYKHLYDLNRNMLPRD